MSIKKVVDITYHAAIPFTWKQWINFDPWIVPEIECLFRKYSRGDEDDWEYIRENHMLYTPSFREESQAQELEDLIVRIQWGGQGEN